MEADLAKERDLNTKVLHGSLLGSFDRLSHTSDYIRGVRINHLPIAVGQMTIGSVKEPLLGDVSPER